MWDVIVVGGGPAGARAAHDLARAGARVAVLERQTVPRYKTCGGGLIPRVRSLLPDSVEPVFEGEHRRVAVRFRGADLFLRVERPRPIVTMTMRAALDHALLASAAAAGARIRSPCTLQTLASDGRGVTLETSQGSMRAAFVVGADGAASRTARAAGWAEPPSGIPALEWEIGVDADAFGAHREQVRIDFGPVPDGYAWIFPKRGHLSVGVLSAHRGPSGLNTRLEGYLRRCGLHPPARVERHGWVIPVAPRREGFAKGRVLLAGDAAGLADAATGEGISHALLSGALAARALLETELDARAAGLRYQDLLQEHILGELRVARLLARLLYRPPPAVQGFLFRRYGQRLSEAMTDVMFGIRRYRDLPARAACLRHIFAQV